MNKQATADTQLEEMAIGDADRTTLVRLWNRVLELMQTQTSRHEFNTWIRRTSLLSIANGVAIVIHGGSTDSRRTERLESGRQWVNGIAIDGMNCHFLSRSARTAR